MEIMHTDVKIVKYSKNAARHIKGSVPLGQFVIMNTIHHYKCLLSPTNYQYHRVARQQSNHLNKANGAEFSCAFKLGFNSFYHSRSAVFF